MKKKLRVLKTRKTFILGSLQIGTEEAIDLLRSDKELEVVPEGIPRIVKFLLEKDNLAIEKIYQIIRFGSIFDYIHSMEAKN